MTLDLADTPAIDWPEGVVVDEWYATVLARIGRLTGEHKRLVRTLWNDLTEADIEPFMRLNIIYPCLPEWDQNATLSADPQGQQGPEKTVKAKE